MKTKRSFLIAILFAVSIWILASCANNQQGATATNTKSSARTYNSAGLQKTGKRDAGEALKAADPSVTTTSGR